jgi:hypothetical protein
MDKEDDNIRDDISAAFEAAEVESADATNTDEPENTLLDGPDGTEESVSQESASAEPEAEPAAEPEAGLDDSQGADSILDEPVGRPAGTEKAPVGWGPEAREKWGALPPEVRQQVADRERDVAVLLQRTTDERKTAQEFNRIAQSYAPIMAAEGAQHPAQAFEHLMGTVAELRMGSPQQKAARVAQLINHYGVDIASLDQVLAGQDPASAPEQASAGVTPEQVQAMIHQQTTAQAQAQHTQNSQAQADKEVAEFSKGAEFLADVREDMADLIEMASRRGQNLGLQDAYDKACALNPSVQNVMSQRKQQESQNRQAAASSVHGSKGGGNVAPTGDSSSIRSALLSAWDNHG